MEKIKFALPFPPSSNTAYPTIKRGNKTIRVKSKKLKDWIESCPELDIEIEGKVTVAYLMFFPDNRERDGQNYLKAPLDYIVSQGVIKDDNRFIVCGEKWFDGGNDKESPRVEITIKKID